MREYLTLYTISPRQASQSSDFQINLRPNLKKRKGTTKVDELADLYNTQIQSLEKEIGSLCLADILNLLSPDGWVPLFWMAGEDFLILSRGD